MGRSNPPTPRAARAAAALWLAGCAASAQAMPTEPSLSVDMPQGGCRLTAWQDGSAAIQFGAAPRSVRSAPGTFDFGTLLRDLQRRSSPQSQRKATGSPAGSLSLPANPELLLIDDGDLIRVLLERAWNARRSPTTPQEVEAYDWVATACKLQ